MNMFFGELRATARSKQLSGLGRARSQILIAGAVILVLALISILAPVAGEVNPQITLSTALMCFLASVVGIFLIKNISRYPGVEESSYIIPSLCVSYGLLTIILIMLRTPYSRLLISGSFATSAIVLFTLYAVLRRRTCLRIGVVPAGEYTALTNLPNVTWLLLDRPDRKIDGVDAVSVDLRYDGIPDEWERKLASFALKGIPVYDLKHLRESLTGKVQIERLSENNLGTLSPLYAYMTIKQILDWVCALLALATLLPIFAFVATAIKLDSRGPIIFRQTRIGYQGRPFLVYKFRSMTVADVDADGQCVRHAAMTKDGDQRVTRVGRFLRHMRIDELPQLVNVLKGEMSWIGPRPEAEVLSRWYEDEIPFYPYRHIVRPGITGWAQVNQGHVADVEDVREKLHFDFYYIKNFSPWIDFVIVGKTIRTVLTGFGSR